MKISITIVNKKTIKKESVEKEKMNTHDIDIKKEMNKEMLLKVMNTMINLLFVC